MAKEPMMTKEQLQLWYVEEGKTLEQIASKFGCDRNNVKYYMKKYGVPTRTRAELAERQKKHHIDPHEIARMVEGGMFLKDIRKELGISSRTLWEITSKAGYNFMNHPGQRKKQSAMLKENNPLDDRELREVAMAKMRKTRMKEYRDMYSEWVEMPFKIYARKARSLAYYQNGRGGYDGEIDHIYSIKHGYDNKVPITVISHPSNLRIVPMIENKKKRFNSHITLEELYRKAERGSNHDD